MDVTPNRGYPFPQCLPPLVEDVSDAPLQTRALAESMAADFTTVSGTIEAAYQLPATILRIKVATSIASGDVVPFNVVEYDGPGWASAPAVIPDTSGVFLLTGYADSVAATNVQSLAIQFMADGTAFHLQGTSPPATSFGRMTASGVTVRTLPGISFGMRLLYSGTSPSNFDNCWLSVTRLVQL